MRSPLLGQAPKTAGDSHCLTLYELPYSGQARLSRHDGRATMSGLRAPSESLKSARAAGLITCKRHYDDARHSVLLLCHQTNREPRCHRKIALHRAGDHTAAKPYFWHAFDAPRAALNPKRSLRPRRWREYIVNVPKSASDYLV